MIESPAPLFQLLYILEMKITFLKFLIESIRKVRPLDQYEVYAAAWPVKQKFAIKNADIVEHVVRKYDTFEEDDFKIHGYNREEMRTQKNSECF